MAVQGSTGGRMFMAGAAFVVALALALSFGAANAAAGTAKPLALDGKAVAAKKKKCKKGKKSATAAKKKCKKKKGGGEEAPPTPAALSAAEVINQVVLRAHQYCLADPSCIASGYYHTPAGTSDPACVSRTTYIWSCLGWNEEDIDADGVVDAECQFLEVVSRTGLSAVTSYQDTTFAGDGWYCFAV